MRTSNWTKGGIAHQSRVVKFHAFRMSSSPDGSDDWLRQISLRTVMVLPLQPPWLYRNGIGMQEVISMSHLLGS